MGSTRRDFLKQTACGIGAAAFGAPLIWARNQSAVVVERPALVVVYLRGGADPLNVIVPYRDRDYYAIRPTIAIPAPGARGLANGERPCLPLTKHFGLHPAMEPLLPLWEKGMLAPIINVGSTHPTRSHFDAQDFMEWAAPGIKSIQEGWLNRYLQATARDDDHFLRGFSPQPLLPRALRGEYSVLAAPGPGSGQALDAFAELYECSGEREDPEKKPAEAAPGAEGKPPVTEEQLDRRLQDAGANTVEKLRHLNGILKDAREDRKKYPRGRLGQQFADIAAVIKARQRLEIAAVDYNGWDHHSYQGGSTGQQANMLRNLAECMAAFTEDLGEARMQNVMVLTMTEFGRTVAENGNQGSDHGHGGFMLAVGGRVAGGRIHGRWTGLSPASLYMRRDLPVYTDFREVFADTLSGLYGFDSQARDFFPGYERPKKRSLELFTTG